MLGITKGITNWNSQQHSVERFTDNAAYTTGHPDDTLVLAGPPRKDDSSETSTAGSNSMLANGMLQRFQFSSQKPTQPMLSIGSGRTYFVSGKSQTTWRLGRLFCNGRNLLRVLYHNAIAGRLDVSKFDDQPALMSTDMYFSNLDSELYYIPFGLGAIFRDKSRGYIGGVYIELAMIASYAIGFNAGQAAIMEDVNGMCDRILPWRTTAQSVAGMTVTQRNAMDAVIGFTQGVNVSYDGTTFPANDGNLTSPFIAP